MIHLLVFLTLLVGIFTEELAIGTAIQGFVDFKNTYNRKYSSAAEEAQRFNCFVENVKRIKNLNLRDHATYAMNKFGDMCANEFKATMLKLDLKDTNLTNIPVVKKETTPKKLFEVVSFDWREKGGVVPVKDQARCGSCWAFCSVCAMEGSWFAAGHELTAFSVEQLVDCAPFSKGCSGGNPALAILFVIISRGITSEDDYPYTAGTTGVPSSCKWSKLLHKVGVFKYLIPAGEVEADYAAYLQKYGPLAIAVDASDWEFYQHGIKSDCQGEEVNHGVNIVGYGVENQMEYWIIRNSWSSDWGEFGYMRLKRGVNCDALTTLVLAVSAKK